MRIPAQISNRLGRKNLIVRVRLFAAVNSSSTVRCPDSGRGEERSDMSISPLTLVAHGNEQRTNFFLHCQHRSTQRPKASPTTDRVRREIDLDRQERQREGPYRRVAPCAVRRAPPPSVISPCIRSLSSANKDPAGFSSVRAVHRAPAYRMTAGQLATETRLVGSRLYKKGGEFAFCVYDTQ